MFIGDAAGRGIFVGTRIESLNVGIDDAVRAAEAVSNAIDKNSFHSNILGERYRRLVEESPYTKDMDEIDKNYLKAFLDCTKQVPNDIVDYRYRAVFKLMSNSTFRGISVGLVNKLGYRRLLPILESNKTYTEVPIKIAETKGKDVQKSYSIRIPAIAERIAKLNYNDDSLSHIKVLDSQSDFMKKMVTLCPTK